METMKLVVQALINPDESIFAEYTEGHNPIKQHLKAVNREWSDEIYTPDSTCYTYAKRRKNGGLIINVSPKSKDAIPITLSFWEEPFELPKQK